jgi:hypothetical protein
MKSDDKNKKTLLCKKKSKVLRKKIPLNLLFKKKIKKE